MAFVAALALVCVSILRPMEIWPWLESFHVLELCAVLAALGVAGAFAFGRERSFYSPQLPFLLGFLLVSYGASAVMLGSEGVGRATTRSLLGSVFMVVVMYGARSVARLRALLAVIVVSAVLVTGVAIHQGMQPPQCIELAENATDVSDGTPDGRGCTTKSACNDDGRANGDYACERVGLFSTTSVERRVRWRGQLDDPNDLAVFLGAVVPILLAAAAATAKRSVKLLALAVIGLELYCVILTQSRGGQLMIGAICAIYFVGRFRAKGLLGVALALPVFLFGGRSGGDSSTEERVDLLYDGIDLVIRHPLVGLGINGFQEELHGMTAHNAYLLAAAELGLPGMFFWTGLLWSSLKIPLTILRRPPRQLDPAARVIALALVASLLGMGVGIFFLSFTFKQVLFVWLGLCGALYGTAQSTDPDFRVRIGLRDCVGIVAFDVLLLAALFGYTRLTA